jgi:hypothetical protein
VIIFFLSSFETSAADLPKFAVFGACHAFLLPAQRHARFHECVVFAIFEGSALPRRSARLLPDC